MRAFIIDWITLRIRGSRIVKNLDRAHTTLPAADELGQRIQSKSIREEARIKAGVRLLSLPGEAMERSVVFRW